MTILAIDTSTVACSIALQYQGLVHSFNKIAPMQQGRLVLPAIQSLLSEFGLAASDIDAIVFGVGPGSFTGIRITSSIVQALGFVENCALYPVSSLAILAQTAYQKNNGSRQLVAVDARMKKVYLAAYELNEKGVMVLAGEETAHSLNSVQPDSIKFSTNLNVYAIGDAWSQWGTSLEAALKIQPDNIDAQLLPDAQNAFILAEDKINRGDAGVVACKALPQYVV